MLAKCIGNVWHVVELLSTEMFLLERSNLPVSAFTHFPHPLGITDAASAKRNEIKFVIIHAPNQFADSLFHFSRRLLAREALHHIQLKPHAAHRYDGRIAQLPGPARQVQVAPWPFGPPEPPGRHMEQIHAGSAKRPQHRAQLIGTLDDLRVKFDFLPLR